MVLAADYPFIDILWTMIIFFAWVVWIWMVVLIIIDVFRRRDIGGWAKAGWTVFIIVIPFIAALIYLIANHDGMADRAAERMRGQQAQFDSYVRTVADSGGAASEIDRAKKLLDDGAITQSEFEALKAKALAAA
jgi:Short C-terminal domain/Phospholipase_D-nuclease N-terminal